MKIYNKFENEDFACDDYIETEVKSFEEIDESLLKLGYNIFKNKEGFMVLLKNPVPIVI